MLKFVNGVSYFTIILLLVGFTLPAMGQINVTVNFNAATVLDTLSEKDFVQLRGEIRGVEGDNDPLPGNDTIRWGNTSTLIMDNIGGDYWTIDFQMNTGDTIMYKIWPGHDKDTGTHPGGGWEAGFENEIGVDTRWFIAGESDSTLPLQYYHAPVEGAAAVNQFWRPFESKEDSIAVHFRVNMAGEVELQGLDLMVIDTIGVRGDSTSSAGVLNWGRTQVVLNWETNSLDSSFYSATAYIPVEKAGTQQPYKFVYHKPDGGVTWESTPDRMLNYPAQDTTLQWKYFSDQRPTGKVPVSSIITWRASTEALEGIGLFDRGVGDEIEIRGPKGWDAPDALELNFNAILQEWVVQEPFETIVGTELAYKYFIGWDSSRVDTNSANYIPMLNIDQGWEEPGVGDFGFDRQFFNSVPANGIIPKDVSVTFNVDMTKAADPNHNTSEDLFTAGEDTVWIQYDGELTAWSQGYEIFGGRPIMLEDPDQDMVYSGTLNMTVNETFPAVWYAMGYIIAYSTADGSAITNGGGNEEGRRYLQYIHPTAIDPGEPWPITSWPDAFDFPVVEWTESDLFVEKPPPDLTTPTGIGDKNNIPWQYALEQNFPNPFNPTTTIRYQIAENSDVKISVYNIAGQLVQTVVNENQIPGKYTAVWDGKNSSGQNVASGIYFLKMKAGEFSKVRKMALIR
jgi:hypothetical protein